MHILRRVTEYINYSSSSFPVIVGLILVVAFITLLLVVIFTLISIKRSTVKTNRVLDLPPSAFAGKQSVPAEIRAIVPPAMKRGLPLIWMLGERLNRFLINRGYIKANEIIKLFFKANHYLKKHLGVKYKYSLPWFMIIGPADSGKSSLLRGFTHDELYSESSNKEPLTWWFLKNGVVFDIRGDIFISKTGYKSDDKSWETIMHLLNRYRNTKPINGIILAIPATEMYGKQKLPLEELKIRAQYIARKLSFTQFYLGMKLPVYIVITKTDVVPGFQSFCSELPIRNRGNMLGWSYPYDLGTVYHPSMLEKGFAEFEDELNNLRMEIFAENLIPSMKDGIFVFPSELMSLKSALSIYINTIFKDVSDGENAYFRGFYFTGDSKMVPLEKLTESDVALRETEGENQTMAIVGTPDAQVNEAGNVSVEIQDDSNIPRKIFFFEDLLLKKIFMEEGIAAPFRVKLKQANKSILIAKLACSLFVLIGSYGLFRANDTLRATKNTLYPALHRISSIVKLSKGMDLSENNGGGGEAIGNWNSEIVRLLQNMDNLKLSSIFVPASWLSTLNTKLHDTLKISYQRVVIRTIYANLVIKAKKLLSYPALKISKNLNEVLNINKSKEYKQLTQYIFDVLELDSKMKKFQRLRTNINPHDLNELVMYTFHISLGEDFLKNYQNYWFQISDVAYPALDLGKYRATIYRIYDLLFKNFIDHIFKTKTDECLISYLYRFLNDLSQQDIKDKPDIARIHDFSKQLTAGLEGLGNEGETWLDAQEFSPDEEFNKFLSGVQRLLGKTVAQNSKERITDNFKKLKNALEKFNDDLSNKPNAKFETASTLGKSTSSGLFKLESDLRRLCSEGFMRKAEQDKLILDIPEGKMIQWDDELIQYAVDVSQSYDSYISSELPHLPKRIQDGIKLFAQTNLYAVLSDIISKAQSIVDVPLGITGQITAEEMLQRQVQELQGVAPKFLKLLKTLRNDQFGFVFGNLRTLLNKIGFALLDHVDKLLEEQHPYMPLNSSCDFWNGEAGVGLAIYGMADSEELELYLQLQRSMINRLALDFAKPIVDFLNSEYIYDKNFGHNAMFMKWIRLVDEVVGFSKNDPQNSVKKLEHFIKHTLDTYTLNNVTENIPLNELKKDSGDYFLNIIRNVKRTVLSRAEVLIRQRNILRYERLRDYYSKHLERFFPFQNYESTQRVAKDADLDTVRGFFKIYDEYGGNPEAILDQIHQLEEGKEMFNFVTKLHAFREFLGDTFTNDRAAVQVKVEADFEINKRNEANTDYLVDRVFVPNNDAHIEHINPEKSGWWFFADPLEFDLRWASGDRDAQKPRVDGKDADLIVEDRTARFQCVGHWSLLRFLLKYKTTGTNVHLKDKNEVVLRFDVPLSDNKNAKIFLGMILYKTSKTDESLPLSIKVPDILGAMPEIPQSLLSLAEEDILVKRALHEVPASTDLLERKVKKMAQKKKQEVAISPSPVKKSAQPQATQAKTRESKPAKSESKVLDILQDSNIEALGEPIIPVSEEPIG